MAAMKSFCIKKGLSLPISGEPIQEIESARQPSHVALLAADYLGMKPTMLVLQDDRVKRGQPLFEDKKQPGILYTSPGAGKVVAVNRGERRALQSVVIELNDNERSGKVDASAARTEDEAVFQSYTGKNIASLNRQEIRSLLLESGLWTAFRTRPFSKAPAMDSEPHSIFVTAMDTNPLAPSMDAILEGQQEDFERGMIALAKLCEGFVYVCKAKGSKISVNPNTGASLAEFDGIHPAGTAGVHIHFLDPVYRGKTVWHLGAQDAIAIGRLLATGRLPVERIISLAGPQVQKPRLLRTRLGASTETLCQGELKEGDNRILSGSVLSGHAAGGPTHGYLGRYAQQISVLREGREREFMGWMMPGADKFSISRTFLSTFNKSKKYDFTTTTNGSARAMVPFGYFERVMPMDLMPTHLLRALVIGDLEQAEQLGCLELDEEDLALCSFVCAGKIDYGFHLRKTLEAIEKEG